ncbi:choice-of-anchor tandem repeat NxxGxxAF-containing protein [Gimesia sp.]|uniref:DUF7453 family protein n=1 Tax=Gimesia sp. TaxID=2024833 RepID=UPI003A92F919
MFSLLKHLSKTSSSVCSSRNKRKSCRTPIRNWQVQLLEERQLLAGMLTSDDVIVRSGDNAPNLDTGNNDGNFSKFSEEPIINETGLVLFQANVTGSLTSSNSGLFQVSTSGTILNITRQKQPVPAIQDGTLYDGISGAASSIPLPFNDSGQAVFVDRFNGVNYWEDSGIFLGSNGNGPLLLVQEGSDAPGATNGSTNGKFDGLEGTYVTVNNAGRIAFIANLSNTDNGSADNQTVFSTDANGNLIEIARKGQLIPGSQVHRFSSFYSISINNAGQIAFYGETSNSSVPDGIYVSDGDGSPLRVVMQNEQVFNSDGDKFHWNSKISNSVINESGAVAFRSNIDIGEAGIVLGVFIRSGNGDLREIVRTDDQLASEEIYDHSGKNDLVLNNRGDVAFTGDISNDRVLFRYDAGSSRGDLKQIVREGQAVPDSDQVIYGINKYTMNDAGQLAISATIWDGVDSFTRQEALFYYDDLNGLKEIARTGQAFEGSTITHLYFAGNSDAIFLAANGDGINNNGEVTFSYKLENGQLGIAMIDGDLAEAVSLRVVYEPTATDANGEAASLPQSQTWISEWDSCWVEIWVSSANQASNGIAAVDLDFQYNTEYTSATEIEFGASFTQNQSGTINDTEGLIENLSAETTATELGLNDRLLFARIRFESLSTDQVALDISGQSIGPYDLGFELVSPQVDVVAEVPTTLTVVPFSGASIWANPFDLNDDDKIDYRDLIQQVSMYNTRPSESESAYAWFADYDQSDRIDYRDLIALVSNYGKSKANQSEIVYPVNYPEAWADRLLVSLPPSETTTTTGLKQETAEQLVEQAVIQISPQLSSEQSELLSGVEVKVVDLEGSTLGRAAGGTIYLDVNAAGYGWFIDETPTDNSEYAFESQFSLIALPDSDAAGQIDLWTVILHELGHLAGYGHASEGLMEETLSPGVRKLAEWDEEADLFFASLKDNTDLLPF